MTEQSKHSPINRLPIYVFGAGAIGRMHIERALTHPYVQLVGIADPSPEAQQLAQQLNIEWAPDPLDLLASPKAKAVIIATPNNTHTDLGLACIQQGLPVLVEKPISNTIEEGLRLCHAAEAANIPVLVGHQRRHNPILRQAKTLLSNGILGKPVAANVMATWFKPDSYFEMTWRREAGGGPVLINMIHDIDALRYLFGEVVSVQAQSSNCIRQFTVEDTATAMLRFQNGSLATLVVSDTASAPWNWDLAAGEASHYAKQDVDSFFLMGTEASLTLPRLNVFNYKEQKGWHEPLSCSRTPLHTQDPYVEQLRHLWAVAEGLESPICSGRDGLQTLITTQAVLQAAESGQTISLKTN